MKMDKKKMLDSDNPECLMQMAMAVLYMAADKQQSHAEFTTTIDICFKCDTLARKPPQDTERMAAVESLAELIRSL